MKNTQTTDFRIVEAIITKTKVCHVAFSDGVKPYVIPFNFGYHDKILYIHSAPEGRKMEILKKNKNVCVSFDTDCELYIRNEEVACSYSMTFKSVVADSEVEFISDAGQKIEALKLIMKQYTGRDDFTFNMPAINNVAVMRINIAGATARVKG